MGRGALRSCHAIVRGAFTLLHRVCLSVQRDADGLDDVGDCSQAVLTKFTPPACRALEGVH